MAPPPPTLPLAGLRVLVPRDGAWGERVCERVAVHGGQGVVVPLVAFRPLGHTGTLDGAVRRLAAGDYAWLTVTSATTVEVLADRCADTLGTDLDDAVGDTCIAAVGPATADALASHGVEPDLVPQGERSARGMVAAFPAAGPGAGPVLAPHSDLADPTLADGLRARGWAVDDVVAYSTTSGVLDDDQRARLRADLREGRIDAVLLTSGSAVRHLVDAAGAIPEAVVVCCLGPRTVDAAVAAGLRVDVVPENASAEELVDALATFCSTTRHGRASGAATPRRSGPIPEAQP